ncbi:hypothetical protein D1841_07275 [Neglecta sp. X4]|nr:hypothetical protein [Neglectibacter sp. 59]NBJ73113.1 hypothetical protein [Neglectibacter sp. X4]NCE81024.1 hypothetical protein [Neglectibacter sp. X58]
MGGKLLFWDRPFFKRGCGVWGGCYELIEPAGETQSPIGMHRRYKLRVRTLPLDFPLLIPLSPCGIIAAKRLLYLI